MGGKYPHLCFMIDLLLELEPESRFIHINRPINESIRSLTARSTKAHGWLRATPEQCEQLQRALWEAKVEGLCKVVSSRVLTVQYHDLLVDPSREVERITAFLDLNVRSAQRESAVGLVQPISTTRVPGIHRLGNRSRSNSGSITSIRECEGTAAVVPAP